MSIVAVQVGQCGNQLGEEFFDALRSEVAHARPSVSRAIRRTFFGEAAQSVETRQACLGHDDASWRARSVLVDTEPRVVDRCLRRDDTRRGHWHYDMASTFCKQGGAANNWAFGFNHYGPVVADDVMARIYREAERCDRLDGFIVFNSVAGGTGSGLGSFMLQQIRDNFPATLLANVSVWPFETGEVSVQGYNTVLSLASAYEDADMVFIFENERFLEVCRQCFAEAQPSLGSVNRAICKSLIHSVLPCRSSQALGTPCCPLPRLASHLCSHAAYRLVTARGVPQVAHGAEAFSSDSWTALQRRILQMCERGSIMDRLAVSVGSGASARAAGSSTVKPSGVSADLATPHDANYFRDGRVCKSVASAAMLWGVGAVEAELEDLRRLPMWRFALDPCQIHADVHKLWGSERNLGLLSNCQTVLPALDATGRRASNMLRASAYVHRYANHGVSHADMSEALLTFAQIRHDYEQL